MRWFRPRYGSVATGTVSDSSAPRSSCCGNAANPVVDAKARANVEFRLGEIEHLVIAKGLQLESRTTRCYGRLKGELGEMIGESGWFRQPSCPQDRARA